MPPSVLAQLRIVWATEPGGSVAHLRGGIDATAAHDLEAIAAVAEASPGDVVVDLSDVQYVDVNGLDLLEELAGHDRIVLRDPSSALCRLLSRTAGIVDWPVLRHRL